MSRSGRIGTAVCFLLVSMMCGCSRQSPTPEKSVEWTEAVPGTPSSGPAAAEPPFQLEEGFVLLTRDDFDAFGADDGTWTPTTDGIACAGKPRGYLYSKQAYENFTWRLEYRFPRKTGLQDDEKYKGNTGFLIDITGEHKLWPVCLEVQGKFIQMGAIKENGGADPIIAEDDQAARQKARHRVGEWNVLQIVSKDGAVNVSLNGTAISHAQPGQLKNGLIGIQAEDHPFEVRRMRIHSD